MIGRRKKLLDRRRREHEKRLTSQVVNISYLLKSEKKINYSIIDKWMEKIRNKIRSLKKHKVAEDRKEVE
jgi:hypothetical protein